MGDGDPLRRAGAVLSEDAVNQAGTVPAIGLRRPLELAGAAAIAFLVALLGVLVGIGWLYVWRGWRWFGVGPRIGDSLPLLQLAGFDGQPLLRVLLAWVLAGGLAGAGLAGIGLRGMGRVRGSALTLALALALLLLAAQASYALTRNLRFATVLFSHPPGPGPFLESLAFATGCGLVQLAWAARGRDRSRTRRRGRLSFGDRRLRGGEDGHREEHGRDRRNVQTDESGAGAQ